MLNAIFLYRHRWLATLTPLALLAACSGGAIPPAQGVHSLPPVRHLHPLPRRAPPLPQPKMQSLPGLEGVIGAHTGELSRQFGTPRLDVWEGDARKLQFVGPACVLDVYLYPLAPGREPEATYVDARRATDGRDVDRAACIAALRQR